MNKNAVSSERYRQYRQSYDWMFDTPVVDQEVVTFDNGKYVIDFFDYAGTGTDDKTGEPLNLDACRFRVTDRSGHLIKEIKSLENHRMVKLICHKDGQGYLVFRMDLYGYSMLNLKTGEQADFFPEERLDGEEPFIWCDVTYCPINNLLVVEGCYWACPTEYEFYDFSYPLQLPLPMYCDSLELKQELGIEMKVTWDTTISFTDNGEFVFEGYEKEELLAKHVIDIVNRKKENE